ncbi:hypothetical protein ACIQY5_14075 [Peribacillus frigoritolerans]|uniref:hypothetical protein n=1 Tax=Peribacillus frigoritolerans TaxID=450367 RepID=UPI0038122FDD
MLMALEERITAHASYINMENVIRVLNEIDSSSHTFPLSLMIRNNKHKFFKKYILIISIIGIIIKNIGGKH